jgi:hypothetical protein
MIRKRFVFSFFFTSSEHDTFLVKEVLDISLQVLLLIKISKKIDMDKMII